MDWSIDIPAASISSSLYVSSASECMSMSYISSHVSLYNMDSNGKNRTESSASVLDYGKGQLAIANSWDRVHQVLQVLSILGTEDSQAKDSKIIYKSIRRIGIYIKHHLTNKTTSKEDFMPVVKMLWKLIDMIYIAKWDSLIFNKERNLTIRKCVREYIMPIYK